MFKFLLLSHAASLVLTDIFPYHIFFLRANEAVCGFLHYSSYWGCYCIPWLLLMRCLFSQRWLQWLLLKYKNNLCADSFPRFGIFTKFMMVFQIWILASFTWLSDSQKSTSGECLRKALSLQERVRHHPHDSRGLWLSSHPKALTWQNLCRLCKTFSVGASLLETQRTSCPPQCPGGHQGDVLTPGCFHVTQVTPCNPKEVTTKPQGSEKHRIDWLGKDL